MKTERDIKLFKVVLLLILSSFSMTAFAQQNDVRKGMQIIDALEVAKKCALEASGFYDNRPKKPYKQARPQDSLAFLGITDEVRLDALRRYLVRNKEIGVQSIWGKNTNGLAQPYLISYATFAEMKSDWTLIKLAQIISENAGLPHLPESTSAQIVADCRQAVTGQENKLSLKNGGFEVKISDDITDSEKRKEFLSCVFDENNSLEKKVGITTKRIVDPQGDVYFYKLNDSNKLTLSNTLNTLTYIGLIESLAKNAEIVFSSEMTAIKLIVYSVGKNKNTICGTKNYFKLMDLCNGIPFNEDTNLDKLGISVSSFLANLNPEESFNLKEFRLAKDKRKTGNLPDFTGLSNISTTKWKDRTDWKITGKTPIWQIIEILAEYMDNSK